MKIIHVLGGKEDGGLEMHTLELCARLIKRQCEVWVVAHEIFKKDFEKIGTNFVSLDLSKNRYNPFILFLLYKHICHIKPDIVHAQASKASSIVATIKPFLHCKTVSTIHNIKKNTHSYNRTDWVVAVSDRVKSLIKNKNSITIYNGIKDVPIQSIGLRQTYNIPTDTFILCAVGRLVEAKGFDSLLVQISKLEHKVHLFIIGDGEEKGHLEAIINELSLHKKVTLIGSLKHETTQAFIKESDMVVISSIKEGFSYVFAESLYLQTPVISTDVADIKKFIPQNCVASLENLYFVIDTFLSNYEKNIKEYQPFFKHAKEELSVDNMVDKTLKLYMKIVK